MELFTKEVSIKAEEFVNDGEVVAYLSTFKNADKVGDIIEAGAFDEFVKNFDPSVKKLPMLYSHRVENLIGEWVELSVDEHGIKGRGIIYTDTTGGKDVHALLKRGALGAVSIGFKSSDYEEIETGGRAFKQCELIETSIVLNPCNPKAEVLSVKSEDGQIQVSELKSVLRNAGMNRSEIEALFNKGWSGIKSLRSSEEFEEKGEEIFDILTSFKL